MTLNFIQALRFPYRSIPKILSIALVAIIALAAVASILRFAEQSWLNMPEYQASSPSESRQLRYLIEDKMFGLALIAIVISFAVAATWLSGYSVDVIRHLVRGGRSLPAIRFRANIGEGFWLLLSRVILAGVLTIFLFPLAAIASPLGDVAVLGLLAIVGFLLTLQYFVGMARYAVRDDDRARLDLRTNLRITWWHRRATAAMVLGQARLVLGYGFMLQLLFGITGALLPKSFLATLESFYMAAGVIIIIFLLQHFSSLYLIAQFASEAGIREYSDNLKTSV